MAIILFILLILLLPAGASAVTISESTTQVSTISPPPAPNATRKVLVIYSYHDTLPWQAKLREALFARLQEIPIEQRPELFEERFEAHRLSSIISNRAFLALLEAKYSTVKLDLIVTENDYAFDFLDHYPDAFPNVKRQFLTYSLGEGNNNVLLIQPNVAEAVKTLLQVLPTTKRIVALVDRTDFIASEQQQLEKSIAPLSAKQVQLEIWNDFSFAELYERVQHLSADTAILYLPLTVDRLGEHKIPREVMLQLNKISPIPIFTSYDSFFGVGAVGGYMMSATQVGRLIAQAVLGLPLPKTRADIDAATKGYYFDDVGLKRWGIPDSNLPPDSIIINRKVSDWVKHRWKIAAAFFALIFESLLIMTLLHNLRLRKEATRALADERDLLDSRVMERTAELEKSHTLLKTAQNAASMGHYIIDLEAKTWTSDALFDDIFGINSHFTRDFSHWQSVIHPDDRQHVMNFFEERLNNHEPFPVVEYRITRPSDGEVRWIAAWEYHFYDDNDLVIQRVGMLQDITKRKNAEDQIKQLAFYDPLTQLPNRRLLQERLRQSIKLSRRSGHLVAVLLLDLDKFKAVNDNFGHAAGDDLLQQVATRIKACLREMDTLARLGGDEFVILLEEIEIDDAKYIEHIAHIATAVINNLSLAFSLGEHNDVYIGASIGIGLYPQHGNSSEQLMDNADTALYHAKDSGRGCFAYFSDDLIQKARARLALESRLRKAIEQQELQVYFQAQVDVASGLLVGAEALVRWHDPIHGLIMPSDFIAIAEDTGLIVPLGEFVLRETCRIGKQWLDQGYAAIILAVNVSPFQFRRCDLNALVMQVLSETGFPARLLELEITESGLMENQQHALMTLNALHEQGVHLAIDDFGTGYSSLSYLKFLPLDVLKIDKSFIDDIPFLQSDIAITSTIIAMAHHLGFKVLAEGVETPEQLAFLQEQGCDSYQGYLYSKPLWAIEFATLLSVTASPRR